MSEPKRREVRRTHLDASVVPVERALLARAEKLEAGWDALHEFTANAAIPAVVAAAFRELAEELHWW